VKGAPSRGKSGSPGLLRARRSSLFGRWLVASPLPTWITTVHTEIWHWSERRGLRGLIATQPEPPLRIQIERSSDRDCVAVLGELDIATAPSLDDAVLGLEDARPGLLVIDLTGVSFIDSTGLSVLLTASNRAREQGRRLVVVRPPLPALRVFTLTRVDAGMECVDDPLDVTGQQGDRETTYATVLNLKRRVVADQRASVERTEPGS
jgi:anti-sigma B factor antagonist